MVKIDETLMAGIMKRLDSSIGIQGTDQAVSLYGAGEYGQVLYKYLRSKGVSINAIVDKYVTGKKENFGDRQIQSPEAYAGTYSAETLIVTPYSLCANDERRSAQRAVFRELGVTQVRFLDIWAIRAVYLAHSIEMSRCENLLEQLGDSLSKDIYTEYIDSALEGRAMRPEYCRPGHSQYIDRDLFTLGKDDYIVDCGAFIGDTAERFCENFPDIAGITAIEPTPDTFKKLETVSRSLPVPVRALNMATGSHNGECSFSVRGAASGNRLSDYSEEEFSVPVVRLDDCMENSRPGFIKMDVEGAELDSLKGAEKTIIDSRPILAICIYHKWEDLWEIPEYIKSLCPDYKLFVRKYTQGIYELVLYAVPPERLAAGDK